MWRDAPRRNKTFMPFRNMWHGAPRRNKTLTPLCNMWHATPRRNKPTTPLCNKWHDAPRRNKTLTPLCNMWHDAPRRNKTPTPFRNKWHDAPRRNKTLATLRKCHVVAYYSDEWLRLASYSIFPKASVSGRLPGISSGHRLQTVVRSMMRSRKARTSLRRRSSDSDSRSSA